MSRVIISSINAMIHPLTNKFKDTNQQQIGVLLELCARIPDRAGIDVRSFLHWVKPAVLHHQYLLLLREGDVLPYGYISWAWVNEATLTRYINDERFILHPSEWNEGEHFVIMDFCCLGDASYCLRHLFKKRWELKKKSGLDTVYYRRPLLKGIITNGCRVKLSRR
ncbi:ACP:hemolysin acyltransferase (hemolysin-activating protein) [Serratia fonticola]|nr:ACP:hemolysin acyltransferase (hemolysin-activating protein) [Serratia fonticola]